MTINKSNFTENKASYTINNSTAGGGAIVNQGDYLKIHDSNFTNNQGGYDGGAILSFMLELI